MLEMRYARENHKGARSGLNGLSKCVAIGCRSVTYNLGIDNNNYYTYTYVYYIL